jgi:hypothetical protein
MAPFGQYGTSTHDRGQFKLCGLDYLGIRVRLKVDNEISQLVIEAPYFLIAATSSPDPAPHLETD